MGNNRQSAALSLNEDKILEQYLIKCYSYKRWSSETIQKWSKFQEELKSTDIDFNSLTSQGKTALYKKLTI